MSVFLLILTILAIVVSLFQIVAGIREKDLGPFKIGGGILISTLVLSIFYFLGWMIPIIVVFGAFGSLCAFLGIAGEKDTNFQDVGVIYGIISIVLYFICFYYWYQEGAYLSMETALLILFTILIIHAFKVKGIPFMSSTMLLICAYAFIYVARRHDINIVHVLIVGGLLSLYLYIIGLEAKKRLFWTKFGAMDFIAPFLNKKTRDFSRVFHMNI